MLENKKHRINNLNKYICILVVFLTMIQCTRKVEVAQGSKIISKLSVFDENISPNLNVCSVKPIKEFKENKGEECIFKLDKFIFEVEYKMKINDVGHMITYQDHTVSDNINFEKIGIKKSNLNPYELNSNDVFVKFSSNYDAIIDGKDTLKIERVFPLEKLVFIEEKSKNGRRIIYEYK